MSRRRNDSWARSSAKAADSDRPYRKAWTLLQWRSNRSAMDFHQKISELIETVSPFRARRAFVPMTGRQTRARRERRSGVGSDHGATNPHRRHRSHATLPRYCSYRIMPTTAVMRFDVPEVPTV